jgi:hypothetical protein
MGIARLRCHRDRVPDRNDLAEDRRDGSAALRFTFHALSLGRLAKGGFATGDDRERDGDCAGDQRRQGNSADGDSETVPSQRHANEVRERIAPSIDRLATEQVLNILL